MGECGWVGGFVSEWVRWCVELVWEWERMRMRTWAGVGARVIDVHVRDCWPSPGKCAGLHARAAAGDQCGGERKRVWVDCGCKRQQ